jgi:methylase of polypeptide subunit release factors
LEILSKIIKNSSRFLKKGGFLALEIGKGQHLKVTEMISSQKVFTDLRIFKDLSGIERAVLAFKGN